MRWMVAKPSTPAPLWGREHLRVPRGRPGTRSRKLPMGLAVEYYITKPWGRSIVESAVRASLGGRQAEGEEVANGDSSTAFTRSATLTSASVVRK